MKKEIRILGIDDSPFSFEDEFADVIGVIMRGDHYIEGVLRTKIAIDGMDATEVLTELINETKHKGQLKLVMLDGVALGGFNIVDIDELNDQTGLPIMTVTREKPDFEKIKEALKKHFNDWEKRWEIISRGKISRIGLVYVKCSGISSLDAREVIKLSTIRGAIPEPIRIAHLIATGIKTGESYGRA